MRKEGVASDGVFMVSYDETPFKAISQTELDGWVPIWLVEAKNAGCKHFAIRVVPDSLFSNDKPYIAFQQPLEVAPWKVLVHVEIRLAPDTIFQNSREQIISRLRAAYGATGCTYSITSDYAGTLEQGAI